MIEKFPISQDSQTQAQVASVILVREVEQKMKRDLYKFRLANAFQTAMCCYIPTEDNRGVEAITAKHLPEIAELLK